jgi:hypothetical protein
MQDILVSNAAKLDSQSFTLRESTSCQVPKTMHHHSQYSNIRLHPSQLYTRMCYGNYISFRCPRFKPLPTSLCVRPLSGG